MGWIVRTKVGFQLAKASWALLLQNPCLLIFPLLSALSLLFLAIVLTVPAIVFFTSWIELLPWVISWAGALLSIARPQTIGLALFLICYFTLYFVSLFFTVALTGSILRHFSGEPISVLRGLIMATRRFKAIVIWTLFASIIGVFLKLVEYVIRDWPGRLVSGVAGLTWTLATYFVIPTLVWEGVGPLESIRRSMVIMKERWGESLVTNASFWVFALVLFLPFAGLVYLTVKSWDGNYLIASIVWFILVKVSHSVVKTIVVSALYTYAMGNPLPGAFNTEMLGTCFVSKIRRT